MDCIVFGTAQLIWQQTGGTNSCIIWCSLDQKPAKSHVVTDSAWQNVKPMLLQMAHPETCASLASLYYVNLFFPSKPLGYA